MCESRSKYLIVFIFNSYNKFVSNFVRTKCITTSLNLLPLQIHRLTQVLAPYAVPNDWRLVARNLLLFIAVLVPIGIHDGMF